MVPGRPGDGLAQLLFGLVGAPEADQDLGQVLAQGGVVGRDLEGLTQCVDGVIAGLGHGCFPAGPPSYRAARRIPAYLNSESSLAVGLSMRSPARAVGREAPTPTPTTPTCICGASSTSLMGRSAANVGGVVE